jgi:hypothetical protein
VIQDLLTDQATVWKVVATDTWGMGTIDTRWELRTRLYVDTQGQQRGSNSVIYTAVYLEPGWLIAEGVFGTDEPDASARVIEAVERQRTPDGTLTLWTALL